eukprot:gene2330-2798_t
MLLKIFIVLLLLCSGSNSEFLKGCLEITEENLEQSVKKFSHIFLLAHYSWDPLVYDFKNEMEFSQKKFKKENFTIASLEMNTNDKVQKRFGFLHSPTLVFIINGEIVSYYRNLKKRNYILPYIKRMVNFGEIEIFKSIEDVSSFMKIEDEFVLGFFESSNSTEFEAYQKLSSSFQNGLRFTSFITENENEFINFIKNDTFNLIYDPEKSLMTLYSKKRLSQVPKNENMIDWIAEHSEMSKPVIFEIGAMNFDDVFNSKKPTFLLFLGNNKEKNHHLLKQYKGVVYELLKSIPLIETQLFANFAFIDGVRFEHVVKEINPNMSFPAFYLIQNKHYYECIDCDDTQNISDQTKEMIKKYQTGKLFQIYKSEENEKELTFNTFESTVYDENFNILILFYAPLCHHCTHFHHFFEELDEKFMKMNNFIKMKYNLKTNSVPIVLESYIDSIPKIAFITKSNKIAFYQGLRSFHHLKIWIQQITEIIVKETVDATKINSNLPK